MANLINSLLFLSLLLNGYQPQQRDDHLRLGVNVVSVDVSVTDKRGRFVRDLRAQDFVVTEDGIEQKVDSFSRGSLSGGEPAASRTGEKGKEGPDSARPFGGYRFVSIVIDNNSLEASNRDPVAKALSRFIRERVGGDDLVAIYSISNSLVVVQPFTGDKQKLLDAVPKSLSGASATDAAALRQEASQATEAAAKTEGSGTPVEQADHAARDALNEFASLSDYFQAQSLLRCLRAIVDVQRNLKGAKSVILFSEGAAITASAGYSVDGVISAANSIGVSINCINPAGLVVYRGTPGIDPRGLGLPGRNRVDPYGGEDPTRVVGGENGIERALKRTLNDSPADRFAAIQRLSNETGGASVTNNNDLAAAISALDEESRAHYILSYTPKNQTLDGKFRTIAVKVARPDLSVRNRAGYYAVRSDAAISRDEQVQKLAGDLSAGITPGFPLEVGVSYFPRGAGSYLVPVMLRVPGNAVVTRKTGDRFHGVIDFVMTVKDTTGAVVSTFGRNVTVDLEHNDQLNGLLIQQRLRLGPGTYVIIAAVRDRESQNTSIARRAITVPGCSEGPCLSSIVLAHQVDQAPATMQPSDLGRNVLGFGQQIVLLPTDNTFTTSQPLFLFFRAYSLSGQPSLIAGAGFFKDGKLVQKTPTVRINKPSVQTPEGFALITPFKLADFEPGAYTVRVELVDEATKKRDVKEASFTLVK